MNVLVACEFSAVVRDAFRAKGHDAWSCDLLPTEGNDRWHIEADVYNCFDYIKWDLMIAHPPCTYLSNSGVRHLYSIPSRNGVVTKIHGAERWKKLEESAKFFNWLKSRPVKRICIENPVPHKYAKERIGNYSQLIRPWQFGNPEVRATCLWLINLPLLQPTNIIKERIHKIHMTSPSPERAKIRSRFLPEIANAMAEQWGNL